MEIQFLGTGAGMPSKERNTSSLALKLYDERGTLWLFDCGEATQHQILKTAIRPRKIEKIFITHMHGDHIFGLPGLISSRSFLGGEEPLTIYGPKEIQTWIETTFQVSKTYIPYPLHFVETKEGIVFEDDQFIVEARLLQHVVPCFGYRIEQKPLPGTLLIEKARELGVPKGPLLGKLKRGEDVVLPNGTTVYSKDVLSPSKKGFVVTILGDTTYCENAIYLSQDADIVVHESTFDHDTEHLASKYGHSTNVEAAKIAKNANAKNLILNHLSARFLPKDLERIVDEAKLVFPNVWLANDFAEFTLNAGTLIEKSV